ncbi:MAG: hypothetical protein MUC87_02815 [Bacteroidia bacterium]|jgi:hypothetical protein|nr:hypothetical protein [Bacteroidia bacterium]
MKKKKGDGVGGKLTTKLLEELASKASRKAVQKAFETGESIVFLRKGKLMRRNPDGTIEILEEDTAQKNEEPVKLKKGDVIKLKLK